MTVSGPKRLAGVVKMTPREPMLFAPRMDLPC